MQQIHVIILALVLIIFVGLVAVKKKDSFLDRFGLHFNILTGTFIAIGVVLTMKFLENNNTELLTSHTLKSIDRVFVVLDRFEEYRNKCPRFIASMFFDFQRPAFTQSPPVTASTPPDDWAAVMILGNKIFQMWEDEITLATTDELDQDVWIASFLQFAKSPLLQDMWPNYKYDYSKAAQALGDLLFEYANKQPITNAEQWHRVAVSLTEDPRFKDIMPQTTLF
jgi:hypothetical protein